MHKQQSNHNHAVKFWDELEGEQCQDFTIKELEQVTTKLSRYTIESPPLDETQQLATKLTQHWQQLNSGDAPDTVQKVHVQASSTPPTIMRVLQFLRPQLLIFTLPMWAGIILLLMASAWLGLYTDPFIANPLAYIAPLLAALCICFGFRSFGTPMFELEMSLPLSPIQFVLARLTLISGVISLVTLVASLMFGGIASVQQLALLTLSWLIPLGLFSFMALAVMLYFGLYAGIGVTIVFWVVQMTVEHQLGPFYLFHTELSQYWLQSKLIACLAMVLLGLVAIRKLKQLGQPGRQLA